ncbi:hypothetical protein DM860_010709 [Cuscuta australis]|uniref:AT-hook motif nuclear-localized protein n=1 Tax=Cuscuta australis TaxID=267555 RepID=A0A328DZT8_9ASTE|nr:hypothetical protein DM860_010709 [Cuscuta australis]
MEPNESTGLGSFYHHHQSVHQSSAAATPTTAVPPTNGIVPNFGDSNPAAAVGTAASHMAYPSSLQSAGSSPTEPVKKKRGRPRKYDTPEEAAAARRAAAASNTLPKKRDQVQLGDGGVQGDGGSGGRPRGSGGSSYALKNHPFSAIGDVGKGFTPYIINVVAGEDVSNKIMTFMQQSKRDICILSASGAVSSASLLQPSTSGGNITYEGRFDILSLSGSYVRNGCGGKTGGLSVCLGSSDGQIIGGGVGGPLTAAGQIQVIVGTFVVDPKKDTTTGGMIPQEAPPAAQVGVSPFPPGVGFQPGGVNPSHQFMAHQQQPQQRGVQPMPLQSFHWRGDAGPMMHHSPDNEDYE